MTQIFVLAPSSHNAANHKIIIIAPRRPWRRSLHVASSVVRCTSPPPSFAARRQQSPLTPVNQKNTTSTATFVRRCADVSPFSTMMAKARWATMMATARRATTTMAVARRATTTMATARRATARQDTATTTTILTSVSYHRIRDAPSSRQKQNQPARRKRRTTTTFITRTDQLMKNDNDQQRRRGE